MQLMAGRSGSRQRNRISRTGIVRDQFQGLASDGRGRTSRARAGAAVHMRDFLSGEASALLSGLPAERARAAQTI